MKIVLFLKLISHDFWNYGSFWNKIVLAGFNHFLVIVKIDKFLTVYLHSMNFKILELGHFCSTFFTNKGLFLLMNNSGMYLKFVLSFKTN